LSQNFISPGAAERLVRTAAPRTDLPVLEVGAGRGAVTAALVPHCRDVTAYEVDARHAAVLRARFAGDARVRVVAGDFLAARAPHEPFAVVGNVPFARTSDIVEWCLAAPALTEATLLTQWEYARKRTGGYGRWTLRVVRTWPSHEWRAHGRFARTEFRPVPRVDAGVLRLTRRAVPLLDGARLRGYEALVDTGFAGRGGSLYTSLRAHAGARRLAAAFREARVPLDAPVGYVAPAQWLVLADELAH